MTYVTPNGHFHLKAFHYCLCKIIDTTKCLTLFKRIFIHNNQNEHNNMYFCFVAITVRGNVIIYESHIIQINTIKVNSNMTLKKEVIDPELPLAPQSSWLLLGTALSGFPSKWTG